MSLEPKWKVPLQFVLGAALTFLFLYMMAPLTVPIFLGGVIAILAYPAFERCRKKASPNVSAAIVTTGVTLLILIPVVILFTGATYKLLELVNKLRLVREGQTMETLAQNPFIQKVINAFARLFPVDQEFIKGQALSVVTSFVEIVSRGIAGFLGSIPGLALATFVVLLSTFFFLTDGAQFLRFLGNLSPLKPERSESLYHSFEQSCRGVVLGLFLSAVVQGILLALLFYITGLPDPVFIGLVTVIAGMVPLVGSSPIWIGATIYLFGTHQPLAAAIMLVGGIAISISDNIVRPMVMRDHSAMHPFLALVSVFGAINLLGPTGIFLGPIIAAVFVSFLKIVSSEIRREKQII